MLIGMYVSYLKPLRLASLKLFSDVSFSWDADELLHFRCSTLEQQQADEWDHNLCYVTDNWLCSGAAIMCDAKVTIISTSPTS